MSRRCVITGMGVVSPLGSTVDSMWENAKNGVCGIENITKFDTTDFKVKVAGEVKDFEPEKYMTKKDIKRNDPFAVYAMGAAVQAMDDSGIDMEKEDASRVGVIFGSGVGGLGTMQEQVTRMREKGPSRVSPMFIPMTIGNMAAGNIAIRFGAKGINEDIVTACATATSSIGAAFRNIIHGYADVVITGGAEAGLCEIGIAGFTNLTALSTNPDPKDACKPFDKDRDGFVLGDGAGVLVVEELEHALARNATIYGEIVGYGATSDAYHITLPEKSGAGAAKAMEIAMEEAGIKPEQVSYINAHGTSTPANDSTETNAIKLAFGDAAKDVAVSSTKSMTGHLLGAAGAVEAIMCVKALQEDILPPTINYKMKSETLITFQMRQERLKKLNMRYQIHLDLVDIMQFFVLKSGGSSPMKFDEVKELIAIFEKSDMGEMEIKLDGDSVHLGRNASFSVSNSEKETTKTVIAGSNNDSVTTIENNSAAFEDTTQDKAFEENLKSDVEDDAKTVTAPIVGTYYQSQAPDKPPFVKVGDTIAKGDVVCIIEAMKFMNEVVSEVSGKIIEVLVEDGEFVEFGQPLFRVE